MSWVLVLWEIHPRALVMFWRPLKVSMGQSWAAKSLPSR